MADISKIVVLKPVLALETEALGRLTFRHLSFGAMIELEKRNDAAAFEPATFLDELIGRLGKKEASSGDDLAEADRALSEADIAKLTDAERVAIAEGLVTGLGLHTEPVMATETDEEGRRVSRIAEHKVVLEREEGEPAEVFLLRAWRDHAKRFSEQASKMMKSVLGEASGISESLRKAIAPGLLENITASQRLGAQISQMIPKLGITDQLKGISSITDHVRNLGVGGIGRDFTGLDRGSPSIADIGRPSTLFPTYEDVAPLQLPELDFENPIFETNERLTEMGEHIAEMRALAATTAAMQQSLNTVATQILTQFAEGAEKARKAGYYALAISVISAVLALVAILTGLWGDFRQDGQDRASDRAAQSRLDEELAVRRQELEASNRLAAAIEAQRPPNPAPAKR